MESTELIYLSMVLFTCYGFNLAQGLRAAINRGDTVRVIPKVLCSIYCISVSIIAVKVVSESSFLRTINLLACIYNTFPVSNDLVPKT